MKKKDNFELAIKYGGFMEMDKAYLKSRFVGLSALQIAELLVPAPSVINGLFSELYNTRNPKEATDYFFGMSQAFDMYCEKPGFGLEGQKGYELFRYIRLNVDGKAYGYSYYTDEEQAIIFPELEEKVTQALMFKFARIFPHYLIYEEAGRVLTRRPFDFEKFKDDRDITTSTSAAENRQYLKFYGTNVDDVMRQASQSFGSVTYLQYQANLSRFVVYQSKGD